VLPGASNFYRSALVTGETARHVWRSGDVVHWANWHTSATDHTWLLKLGLECKTACMRSVKRGYPIILPNCHKCRPFYRCTSCLPRPTPLFLPLLFASKSRQWCCIVAFARCQLLFDCGLDSRQRQAAWADIGNRYRVSQSKKYRPIPIHPNTGQYWPIPGIPIPVSFEP